MTRMTIVSAELVESLTWQTLESLMDDRGGIKLSVYLPTPRSTPPDDANRILLKSLVNEAAVASQGTTDAETTGLLGPFIALMDSPLLSAPTHEALAGFSSQHGFRLVALDGSVETELSIDKRCHVLPLISRLASEECSLVVALTERMVRAIVCHLPSVGGGSVTPLPLSRGLFGDKGELFREEIVEHEATEPHRVLHGRGPFAGGKVYGGFGSRSDAIDVDTEHFLRTAAEVIEMCPGRNSGWPLVIVALPQIASVFDHLFAGRCGYKVRISRDPTRLSDAALVRLVGEKSNPERRRRLEQMLDSYRVARSHDRGSDDLSEIALAAVAGQVHTLLIDPDRRKPGGIDGETGKLVPQVHPTGTNSVVHAGATRVNVGPDLYEDLVSIVIDHGGVIVPCDRRRLRESGVAAIYRYANVAD